MIIRIVVDLPAPFGPRKPVTAPDRTENERRSTATFVPNRSVNSAASIMQSHRVSDLPLGVRRYKGAR